MTPTKDLSILLIFKKKKLQFLVLFEISHPQRSCACHPSWSRFSFYYCSSQASVYFFHTVVLNLLIFQMFACSISVLSTRMQTLWVEGFVWCPAHPWSLKQSSLGRKGCNECDKKAGAGNLDQKWEQILSHLLKENMPHFGFARQFLSFA